MPDTFDALGACVSEIRGPREVVEPGSITIAQDRTALTLLHGLAWSRLRIDGRSAGSLCGPSAKTFLLSAGEHRIRVRVIRLFNLFGLQGSRVIEQRVELGAGETLKVLLEMDQVFKRAVKVFQFRKVLNRGLAALGAVAVGWLAWHNQPALVALVTEAVIRFELDEQTSPTLYKWVRTPASAAAIAVILYYMMLIFVFRVIPAVALIRAKEPPDTSYVLVPAE